ncbi:MAG: hypothetical protein RQ754_03495 [Desulfuromonadales bacterium]|nr:hypothetical protein [Desulfuromonadales bacterium]
MRKLYRAEIADSVAEQMVADLQQAVVEPEPIGCRLWSQTDVILSTYGNSVISQDASPLQTLQRFLADRLTGPGSTVHILLFSYSSDDGFSVIDYYRVNPELGC